VLPSRLCLFRNLTNTGTRASKRVPPTIDPIITSVDALFCVVIIGRKEGLNDGAEDGTNDGKNDGSSDGRNDGSSDGRNDGVEDGLFDRKNDGLVDGFDDR